MDFIRTLIASLAQTLGLTVEAQAGRSDYGTAAGGAGSSAHWREGDDILTVRADAGPFNPRQ